MSLDKKLKELLHDYKYQVEMNRDVYARLGNDEYLSILDTAIEAIKQAFIDEGWMGPKASKQAQDRMDALAQEVQRLVPLALANKPKILKITERAAESNGDTLMTGPEWEERAIKDGWRRPE